MAKRSALPPPVLSPLKHRAHPGLQRAGCSHPHQPQPTGKLVETLQAADMLDAGTEDGDWRAPLPSLHLMTTAMT